MELLLSIVGVSSLIICGFDIWLYFYEWQARIHIGKWPDIHLWQKAIENKTRQWLSHTPRMPKLDNERLILIDIIRGKYWSGAVQSWQIAGLVLGLSKQDAEIYIKGEAKFDKARLCADYAFLAYALIVKGLLSDKDMIIMDDFFAKYVTENKTIPYREEYNAFHYVDTLGLACPYLYYRGHYTLVNTMFDEMEEVSLDKILPPHAYNVSTKKPLGLYDWSRGIGWYIISLIFTNDKGERNDKIVSLAEYLMPFEKEEGGFGWMIMDNGANYESSGTAIIGLLYINAFHITKEKKYKEIAIRVEKSLMRATRRTGSIDYAQGDTKGLGRYSTRFSVMPFAQGMTLLFCKELNNIR